MLTFEAAEYATSEVLLASAYRKLLLDTNDASVDLARLTDFAKELNQTFARADTLLAQENLANQLLFENGGIGSPQKSGQLGLQVLRSLMPIVPQVGRHAGVIGKVRNRWNPGNLLIQAIGAGLNEAEGNALIENMRNALSVTSDDDIFARFLEQYMVMAGSNTPPITSTPPKLNPGDMRSFRGAISVEGRSPAERFCMDLSIVLQLKSKLTRRQWTVLLEAVLRLGLSTHVLWVCQANDICWQLVLSTASGIQVPDVSEIEHKIWNSHRQDSPLIEIGRPAKPIIKRILERYLVARFGINIVLFQFEDVGRPFQGLLGFNGTSAADGIREFLVHVQTNRQLISQNAAGWLKEKCVEVSDSKPSHVATNVGATKNLKEFLTYSLGQLKTTPADRRSYDQSFLLTSDEHSREKTQNAQPGPAMLILLAHACCQSQGDLPVSLEDFRLHLADYGLHTPAGELLHGRLCFDLQNLGLIVDSPDAAGGRTLVRPF